MIRISDSHSSEGTETYRTAPQKMVCSFRWKKKALPEVQIWTGMSIKSYWIPGSHPAKEGISTRMNSSFIFGMVDYSGKCLVPLVPSSCLITLHCLPSATHPHCSEAGCICRKCEFKQHLRQSEIRRANLLQMPVMFSTNPCKLSLEHLQAALCSNHPQVIRPGDWEALESTST